MINWFDLFYSLVILGAFTLVFLIFYYEQKTGIVPSPSMPSVRRDVIQIIHNHKNDFESDTPLNIIDIGSGWGGLLQKLGTNFPKANITGYELSPAPFFFSKLFTLFQKNINILNKDFFKENLSECDIIICYLSPWHMNKMKDIKFKSGSLLISCSFPWEQRIPNEIHSSKSMIDIPIFVYRNV